jgi:cytochrome c oxidase cbb3-type subunit 3
MKNIFVLLTLLLLSGASLLAQETATAETAAHKSGTDPNWWLIYGVMLVLLFTILILGNVFLQLYKYILDNRKDLIRNLMILLAVVPLSAIAQDNGSTAVSTAKETSVYFKHFNLLLAGLILFIEFCVVLVLAYRIKTLTDLISGKTETETTVEIKIPAFLEKLNASVAIEKEADILLDHDYDGIKELDNNLPPWWKYGFYLTIIWSLAYLIHFHVLRTGDLSAAEYQIQLDEARIAKENYMKTMKNVVDENNVQMPDDAGLLAGSAIFAANCTPCHGSKGEGNAVGPNLTDDYWLHGAGLNDIFRSVKYGWPNKGMKSWQNDFSASQIQQLSGYIKTLRGTNPPNAKEPQGDLIKAVNETTSTDSMQAGS